MIEEILKFATKHPKVVILSLLTIIASGGIGGGFWVHTLQSELEQREKLTSERLRLVEDRHATDLRALQQANSVLQGQAELIRKSAADVVSRLQELSVLANDIRAKGTVTDEIAPKLQAATTRVTEASEKMSRALERTQDISDWMARLHVEPPTGSIDEAFSLNASPVLIVSGIIILVVIFLFARNRKMTRRDAGT
jgi:hypothetical protein